jgi:hypothetical protein
MELFWNIAGRLPALRLPAGLVSAMFAGCALLAVICTWLLVRRVLTARRHEAHQAANLFMVRELGSYVLGDNPVDLDHLRATLEKAPLASVLQFLRLHRGPTQALVVAQAELAGIFDPALRTLGCGVPSREIEALKQLQFARGPQFRAAVLRQVIRGPTALQRAEALYTFVAMGTRPSEIALAVWIDGTGPELTPRHQALFQLIADRLPDVLPELTALVRTRAFQEQLAVLAAHHAAMHAPLPSIGASAARLRAPIPPSRRAAG